MYAKSRELGFDNYFFSSFQLPAHPSDIYFFFSIISVVLNVGLMVLARPSVRLREVVILRLKIKKLIIIEHVEESV